MSPFEELQRNLRTRIVGRRIHAYEMVISTSDVVRELADRGAEEGTVVFAEEQTCGRGRLGRTWWSPRGRGIWMSVLLRPPVHRGTVPMTTIIGALATADAVRAVTRLPAMIRWPNDVLVGGRKVAGVLVEARTVSRTSSEGSQDRGHVGGDRELVLGIGIDVNVPQAEMPEDIAGFATSLSEAAGEDIDRLKLARTLLIELDRWYRIKLAQNIEAINQRWRELSATFGRTIVLEENGKRYEGTVIDVDARLGLALRLSSGNIRNFRGEHVTVITHG